GGGNSAVQIATELAAHARVSLTTRRPPRFVAQRPFGRDLHFWLNTTGFDRLPVGRWVHHPPTAPVLDTGTYQAALAAGKPDSRPLFTHLDGTKVVWPDGTREHVDTLILATGYQPDLDYLRPLGALSATGNPLHRQGISTTHPGLGYLGLDWQRTPASATLRGVGRDAHRLIPQLSRQPARQP
ncbi:MAG TPA: FAD-dependent oxidoreductase, partial [Micromonosporaceae bacterium]|nr:FAD-dependent oxidoreductase [Micromonosporaceae bacterium]